MGCPPVRKLIHSLKLVDYLHVQADNPWYNCDIALKPMLLSSTVGHKTKKGGQSLLNILSASRATKTKTIRPYGRKELQEISI